MKKFSVSFAMLALVLVFTLALAGCSGGGSEFDEEFNVTSADFYSTFISIMNTPGNYLITLSGNLLDYPGGVWMNTEGVNITVRGTGANRITWKHAETNPLSLFGVAAGKLTVENITLSAAASNTQDWDLLSMFGGTIEMKNGAIINNTGNSISGGVFLQDNSTFIMSGGTITNCIRGITIWGDGNTVKISGGTIENCEQGIGFGGNGSSLTISGGTVRNNTFGGIILWSPSSNCTVSITGGEISGGNSGISIEGGGNHVAISNVKISNTGLNTSNGGGINFASTASDSSVAVSGGDISGIVGVQMRGADNTFTLTGGKIIGDEYGIRVPHGQGNKVIRSGGGQVTGGIKDVVKVVSGTNVVDVEFIGLEYEEI
ncbi:MAG: right-handed parallel beta-helix repeat-containing protein [Treponema sp.]|jgi:hypothetical protein|nr:right-handed parallel beta-helix repeat-containing protein [Treponema sp.]